MMTSMVEMLAGLLRPDLRETVLGDLAESGADAWEGLCSVLGLVIRHQMEPWRSWQPWAAGGLALPGSLLLLGVSFGLSHDLLPVLRRGSMRGAVVFELVLMLAWAWTAGFMVGSLSRRTRWVSAALCAAPCLSCVLRFQDTTLSRFCVLLFLGPALAGAVLGVRRVRLGLLTAIALATSVTWLMLIWQGMSVFNWPLVFPAWWLVLTAERFRIGNRRMTA